MYFNLLTYLQPNSIKQQSQPTQGLKSSSLEVGISLVQHTKQTTLPLAGLIGLGAIEAILSLQESREELPTAPGHQQLRGVWSWQHLHPGEGPGTDTVHYALIILHLILNLSPDEHPFEHIRMVRDVMELEVGELWQGGNNGGLSEWSNVPATCKYSGLAITCQQWTPSTFIHAMRGSYQGS